MKRIVLVAVLFVIASCGVRVDETQITVDENGNLDEVILPDGTKTNGQESYETEIASRVPNVTEMSSMAVTVQSKTTDAGKGVNIGKFKIQIIPDVSYLDGCIRRSFLHLKILVTNTKIDMGSLIEMHLVAWFDSKSPCFAVMNTGFVGYGWCQKICVKDVKKGVADTVKNGLIAAGVTVSVAKIISLIAAPIATAALAI